MVLTDPGLRDMSRKSVEADVNRKFDMENLISAFPGSRVNCRGSRKLSQVRRIELLLFPSFPKAITVTIALKLANNKF